MIFCLFAKPYKLFVNLAGGEGNVKRQSVTGKLKDNNDNFRQLRTT